MYRHKFSLSELNSMLPFEREIFVTLLFQQLQKEAQEQG